MKLLKNKLLIGLIGAGVLLALASPAEARHERRGRAYVGHHARVYVQPRHEFRRHYRHQGGYYYNHGYRPYYSPYYYGYYSGYCR